MLPISRRAGADKADVVGQTAAAGYPERRQQHLVVLVLPEIRRIDQVLSRCKLEPAQDRLIPRRIA